jgi:hypothetical protein
MISWPMLAVTAYSFFTDRFIVRSSEKPAIMFKAESKARRKNRRQFRRKAREEWKKQSMKG